MSRNRDAMPVEGGSRPVSKYAGGGGLQRGEEDVIITN